MQGSKVMSRFSRCGTDCAASDVGSRSAQPLYAVGWQRQLDGGVDGDDFCATDEIGERPGAAKAQGGQLRRRALFLIRHIVQAEHAGAFVRRDAYVAEERRAEPHDLHRTLRVKGTLAGARHDEPAVAVEDLVADRLRV